MERKQLVELVQKYGGSSHDAVLDPTTDIFTIDGVEGLIGYKADNCFVVYGDPVCNKQELSKLVYAFHEFAQSKNKHIIYIAVSHDFATWAISQGPCKARIHFGEELYFDPVVDPIQQGHHHHLVRQKVRKAMRSGLQVHEYHSKDPELENAVNQVAGLWLKHRKGPQVHTTNIRMFEDSLGKRWFYAKRGQEVVGSVMLSSLEAKNGYLLTNLIVTPDAPRGTSELLITSVFETLKNEGCHCIISGTAPSSSLTTITGFNKLFTLLIKLFYRLAYTLFHLGGHKTFWNKFCPKGEPTYLLFSHPHIRIRDALSLKRALHVSML